MERLWSYRDEHDNEIELGKDGDTFVLTVSDMYESAYVSLPMLDAQDLHGALREGLGLPAGE